MTRPRIMPTLARSVVTASFALIFSIALTAQNSGRGFVKAQAGTTLDNLGSGFSAAGGFGLRLTDFLDLYAEAGTVQDMCDYGTIGARVTLPVKSVITPFFELGGGAGRLAPALRRDHPSNINTHFKLTASGGVHLAATRRIGFDFAYRYLRISTIRPAMSTNLFYAGIVYRF